VAKRKGARHAHKGAQPLGADLAFARIDDESSIFRWHMARHGDAVLTEFPGLLARLAQGPAGVALIFEGDRAVGLVAWRPERGEEGAAELLAHHASGPGLDQARLAAFVHGPNGPLAADGITRLWAVAEVKHQVKRLREAGYGIDGQAQPARPALTRLHRPVEIGTVPISNRSK
jgi:hypothetical protein